MNFCRRALKHQDRTVCPVCGVMCVSISVHMAGKHGENRGEWNCKFCPYGRLSDYTECGGRSFQCNTMVQPYMYIGNIFLRASHVIVWRYWNCSNEGSVSQVVFRTSMYTVFDQYTFTSFVGPKLLGPTKCSPNNFELLVLGRVFLICWEEMLGTTVFSSQQFKTVGTGATFSLLLAKEKVCPTPAILNCWE